MLILNFAKLGRNPNEEKNAISLGSAYDSVDGRRQCLGIVFGQVKKQ